MTNSDISHSSDISRRLRGWSWFNTATALLVLVSAALPSVPAAWVVAAVAAWGVLSFAGLWFTGVKAGIAVRNTANILSTIRVALTVAGCFLVLLASISDGGSGLVLAYAALALLLTAQVTDFLDGVAARRDGPTAFGARLDEEVDAFFVAALAVVVHLFFGIGPWILLAGALRYIYLPSLVLVPDAPRRSVAYTWFAKTACAVSIAGLILLTAPFLPQALGTPVAVIVVLTLVASFGWAWLGNLRAAYSDPTAALGLLRSWIVYYCIPFRRRWQIAFYRRLINSPNGTIYDIGAHLGSRTRVFLALGHPVVAVEPQRRFFEIIADKLAEQPNCVLIHGAVGAESGTADIQISDRYPTVSSLSPSWIGAGVAAGVLKGVSYNRSETVRVYSMGELMELYGSPAFIKIDVEGFEYEVIRGLRTPVPALSFEIVPSSLDLTTRCVEHLEGLGRYRYLFTRAERTRFVESRPWKAHELLAYLGSIAMPDRNGDIYAFLADQDGRTTSSSRRASRSR